MKNSNFSGYSKSLIESLIKLRARADGFREPPELRVFVDNDLAGSETVTANSERGEWQDMEFKVGLPRGAQNIRMEMSEEAPARIGGSGGNIQVDQIEINGVALKTPSAADSAPIQSAGFGQFTLPWQGVLDFAISGLRDIFRGRHDREPAPPRARNDRARTDEDESVTVDLLRNDRARDGGELKIVELGEPEHGSVIDNGDGTVSYQPDADFHGRDSFTYVVVDSSGREASATARVRVRSKNDDPNALDDEAQTEAGSPVKIDVLSNDFDVDGNRLKIASVGDAAHGTVKVNRDGTITYTPEEGFAGEDSFTYTVSDRRGGNSTANVKVSVDGLENENPNAEDDQVSTNEDSALNIDLLSNDSDADGDTLSISALGAPAHGTVSLNADGTVKYVPDADFNGQDSFTYTISDGKGGTSSASAAVVVQAVNDGPVAGDDSGSTDEDTALTLNLLSNDSDVDGDALSISALGTPAHGLVSLNTDGTVSYVPNADFNGQDSFTYTISDGKGGTSSASATVVVRAINDGPVAGDDSGSTDEDSTLVLDLLGNDSDVDGDALSISALGVPANGSVSLNTDGTVSYIPNADFNGQDSFTYTIADGNGGTSTAIATVAVRAVNDDPVAGGDSGSADEDTTLTFNLLSNDSDVDGDALGISALGEPANGSVSLNTDGTVSYTPNANFNGQDSFSYTVSDGNGGTSTATAIIVVRAVNDSPVADDDSANTTDGVPVILDLLANDSDVDGDTLTLVSFEQPANGDVFLNDNGTVTYEPFLEFQGSDSFQYTVSDGNGGLSTATATIVIGAPGNASPVAVADGASTDEDSPVILNLLANDSDSDGDVLSISALGTPANGTVSLNADGTVSYIPNADFNGQDSFTYTISDGNGGSSTASATVVVRAVNDSPILQDDVANDTEDHNTTIINLLSNDSDADGDVLTLVSFEQPLHGTVTDNGDGTVTYLPDPDFNGEDSFQYTATDGNGGTATATATIVVAAVNDNPVAADDAGTTNEDSSVLIDLLSNDGDIDGDQVTLVSIEQPLNGSVTDNGDGTVTYVPKPNFNGDDSFTYAVSDGNGGTATATASVTVVAVNDGPVATDDSATTSNGTSVILDLLANDDDIDGDTVTLASFEQPANGTVFENANGTVTYQPNAGFEGSDSFQYTVSDGNGGLSTALSTIVVSAPSNTNPTAVDDSANTTDGVPVILDLLANDSDADGDQLTLVSFEQPTNGDVFRNDDGTVTYEPFLEFQGSDSFQYTVSDGNGGLSTATARIVIGAPVNASPGAIDDSASTDEDSTLVLNLLSNDSDVDGDALSISALGVPAHGSVSLNADSTVSYTPDADFNGHDSFTYTISDGNGGTATATVSVSVTPVNDGPVANDDAASTSQGSPVTVDVISNDRDADGDTLQVVSAGGASHGSVAINTDGTVTYTPDALFSGTDSFNYDISDGNGGFDTASATITVNPATGGDGGGGEPAPGDGFFVSALGNDGWSGTLAEPNEEGTDGPFATLAQARDAMRADANIDTTYIRGGDYFMEQKLSLDGNDNGVTFTNYPGENPVIHGGGEITGWTEGANGVWTADVGPNFGNIGDLFVDGQRMTHARIPDADPDDPIEGGWLFAESGAGDGTSFQFKTGDIPFMSDISGLKASVFAGNGWNSQVASVDHIDWNTSTVYLKSVGSDSIDAGSRFYLFDAKEGLDQPGEWAYDDVAGTVSFIAPAGFDGTGVSAGQMASLIEVDNASNITVNGLEIGHTAAYNMALDGSVLGTGQAIVLKGSTGITLQNNTIINISDGVGVFGGSGNQILNNEIGHSAGSAITFGWGGSDGNTISGNWMHEGSELYGAYSAIFYANSDDNVISNNLIEHYGKSAIWGGSFSNLGESNNNIIEYNEIRDTNLTSNDGGAIYLIGRTKHDSGDIIRYNKISGTSALQTDAEGNFVPTSQLNGYAIYLDDHQSGVDVYGNYLVENQGGILVHGGLENTITNNMLVNGFVSFQNDIGESMPAGLALNTFSNNAAYFDTFGQEFGGVISIESAVDYVNIDNNAYWSPGNELTDLKYYYWDLSNDSSNSLQSWLDRGFDGSSDYSDLGLTYSLDGFSLDPNSPIYATGYTDIPLDQIGRDAYASDDLVIGGDGAEVLKGFAGNDTLKGWGGDDVLIGGIGDDVMTGGAGNDVFVFGAGSGSDTITDFGGGDTIDLRAFGLGGLNDLSISANAGGDAKISLSSGEDIVLIGVSIASLDEQDFLF